MLPYAQVVLFIVFVYTTPRMTRIALACKDIMKMNKQNVKNVEVVVTNVFLIRINASLAMKAKYLTILNAFVRTDFMKIQLHICVIIAIRIARLA